MSDKAKETSKVAFSHDSMSTDLNPRPEKVGRLAKMFSTVPKTIATIVILILIIILVIHVKGNSESYPLQRGDLIRRTFTPRPAFSGEYITITKHSWEGKQNYDPTRAIVATMLTPGTWWQVRVDGKDCNVFDLYPADWNPEEALYLPPGNLLEWRIHPTANSNRVSQAKVLVQIVPRTRL